MSTHTATATESSLHSRERALVCMVAYMALKKGSDDLNCSRSTAREQGFTEQEIERIQNYVNSLQAKKPEEEETLSALLTQAGRSSCCS